jgi:hypothetical protein
MECGKDGFLAIKEKQVSFAAYQFGDEAHGAGTSGQTNADDPVARLLHDPLDACPLDSCAKELAERRGSWRVGPFLGQDMDAGSLWIG